MPASKNVWNLKKICYELKNEGTFVNVRGTDRGILINYEVKDQQDESKKAIKSITVTSEKEVDDLRKLLKVDDAYISVAEKYNNNYWKNKNKSEMTQKRGREDDDNEIVDPKRQLSSTQTQ